MSQTSRQSEVDSLQELVAAVDALGDRIEAHLAEYPSPILSHHRRGLTDITTAAYRQIDRIHAEELKAIEHEERKAAHAVERKYDQHTKDMAERMGITPEAFLELQEQRRREMRGAPGTVTYSPDHEVIG